MSFSVPFTFAPNTLAQSAEVNADFQACITAANSLQAQITSVVGALFVPPQGRLTLTSLTPVMATNVVNTGTVYYTPYVGNVVPLYSGTVLVVNSFAEQNLILDTASHLLGSLYDVFAYLNGSSVVAIGTGPAWTNTTTRSLSLARVSGILVNSANTTLTNNAAGTAVSAQMATYLGTLFCSANGKTTFNVTPAATSGGAGNLLGLYNAYNRVRFSAQNLDNASPYSASVANTWLPLGAGTVQNNNSISWVDGLGQSPVQAEFMCAIAGASPNAGFLGINFDSPTATPASQGGLNPFGGSVGASVTAQASSLPLVGLHYAQAMFQSTTATTGIIFGLSGSIRSEAFSLQVEL